MQITETKSKGLSREYKVSLSAEEIAEKVDLYFGRHGTKWQNKITLNGADFQIVSA